MRISLWIVILLVTGLPRGTSAATFVGISNVTQTLYELNSATGASVLIGPTGIPSTVYGACTSGVIGHVFATTLDSLYLVDATTGNSTLVGNYNGAATNMREIAYDTATDTLYGTDYASLYTLDPTTATATLLGAHGGGVTALWALTHVPGVGLRGMSGANYVALDATTGLATQIGSTAAGILDVTYDPDLDVLIGGNTASFYHFNVTTGAATLMGTVPNMLGYARVAEMTSAGLLFRRGDANASGSVSLPDVITLLNFLFVPGRPAPVCPDAADANDDGSLSLPDVITMLNYLFAGGSPLVSPGPTQCGPDPTSDGLAACSQTGC
ncbi:MAG: hypothetical protein AB7O52_10755 [Planctomycetota bacterium]